MSIAKSSLIKGGFVVRKVQLKKERVSSLGSSPSPTSRTVFRRKMIQDYSVSSTQAGDLTSLDLNFLIYEIKMIPHAL